MNGMEITLAVLAPNGVFHSEHLEKGILVLEGLEDLRDRMEAQLFLDEREGLVTKTVRTRASVRRTDQTRSRRKKALAKRRKVCVELN